MGILGAWLIRLEAPRAVPCQQPSRSASSSAVPRFAGRLSVRFPAAALELLSHGRFFPNGFDAASSYADFGTDLPATVFNRSPLAWFQPGFPSQL